MKAAIAIAVACTVLGAGALLAPRSVCGCITADRTFKSAFGIDPMRSSPAEARVAWLRRHPAGSPVDEIELALVAAGLSAACGRTEQRLECRYEVREHSLRGFREGFAIRFSVDPQQRIQDVAFERFEQPISASGLHQKPAPARKAS